MSELPTESRSVWETSASHFQRWRDGDPGALDDLVRLLSPMLWQVVRASGARPRHRRGRRADDLADAGALRGDHHRAPRGRRVAVHDRASRGLAGLQAVDPPAARGGRGDRPAAAGRARSRGAGRARRRQRPAVGTAWAGSPSAASSCCASSRPRPRPDYSVIATELDMPVGSIGPTRGRCLDKLRRELAQAGGR